MCCKSTVSYRHLTALDIFPNLKYVRDESNQIQALAKWWSSSFRHSIKDLSTNTETTETQMQKDGTALWTAIHLWAAFECSAWLQLLCLVKSDNRKISWLCSTNFVVRFMQGSQTAKARIVRKRATTEQMRFLVPPLRQHLRATFLWCQGLRVDFIKFL